MAMEDKIDKIRKVARKDAVAKVIDPQENLQRLPPNKERFDNLMQPPKPEKIANEQKFDPSKKTSLMDEVRELNGRNTKPTRVTPTELVAQTEQAINQIDDLKVKLSTPNSTIKDSAVPLLRNKISHVNESIRIALSHAGSEFPDQTTATAPIAPKENVISRFLGLLTDGQYRMETLSNDVQLMASDSTKEINPAKLLLIQIKVNQIQQELEFFAGVLNKALESTKTIMNVQV
jgi:hypothetical protein